MTVSEGDGPDANHQTSTSTFGTAEGKCDKSLREKSNVTSLIANMIMKDMLSNVYDGEKKSTLLYFKSISSSEGSTLPVRALMILL